MQFEVPRRLHLRKVFLHSGHHPPICTNDSAVSDGRRIDVLCFHLVEQIDSVFCFARLGEFGDDDVVETLIRHYTFRATASWNKARASEVPSAVSSTFGRHRTGLLLVHHHWTRFFAGEHEQRLPG